MEYVVVFSKITQFALILLSTFNAPIAFADDTFIYDIFAVDQTTKLPIEDVLITYEFKDVKTGKTDTTSCKTTNTGICTISATVSSSIFSGSHIEGIFRVQKDGYRKEFRSSEKRISNKKFDRTFFLTSNDTPNEYSLVFYKDLIDIKDDDLETIATLTTKPAHKPTGEILPSLHFVRAHIDKKTSAATYQIYILSTYISDSFRSFNIAKFQTPSGPKAVPITNIDKNVNCTDIIKRITKRDDMCTYKETVGFSVEEPLFREISALYKDNKEGQWRFRISSKSGDDIDLSLPYAELAAIIERVDLYKSTRR